MQVLGSNSPVWTELITDSLCVPKKYKQYRSPALWRTCSSTTQFCPPVLKPEQLCDTVMECVREERFLILPHPQVKDYMQRKTADYDRWLRGMRRLQEKFEGVPGGPKL